MHNGRSRIPLQPREAAGEKRAESRVQCCQDVGRIPKTCNISRFLNDEQDFINSAFCSQSPFNLGGSRENTAGRLFWGFLTSMNLMNINPPPGLSSVVPGVLEVPVGRRSWFLLMETSQVVGGREMSRLRDVSSPLRRDQWVFTSIQNPPSGLKLHEPKRRPVGSKSTKRSRECGCRY